MGFLLPVQELSGNIEAPATTKLPLAVDFLKGEILLTGRVSDGMAQLPHYFTPFQTFVMSMAEDDKSRFDQKIALLILERESQYRAESPTPAGLFIYQFECIARNRLGYDNGMIAMADDPSFDDNWRDWMEWAMLAKISQLSVLVVGGMAIYLGLLFVAGLRWQHIHR